MCVAAQSHILGERDGKERESMAINCEVCMIMRTRKMKKLKCSVDRLTTGQIKKKKNLVMKWSIFVRISAILTFSIFKSGPDFSNFKPFISSNN